jgi:serine/threonine-protein kinase
MAVLDSINLLLGSLREAGLLEPEVLKQLGTRFADGRTQPEAVVRDLVMRELLTPYQAERVLAGRAFDLALGQYVVLERLGQGGTGEVFKARHRVMRRMAAVKVIRPELLSSAATVQRFYREVEATSRLRHPHIVEAYDAGPVGDTHFFAMELIEGTDLSKLVQRSGPMPVGLACHYIRQTALALQHAHEKGLIHRDVKPSNLIVARDGRVKLLDLGLVRLGAATAAGPASPTITENGGFMGTPDFMAPEQAEDSHAVDHRADLYSVGATLYYLLTGRLLFPDCSLYQKLLRLQSAQPVPIEELRPGLPPPLIALLRRLMAKDPADRPQSAAEVIRALGELPLSTDAIAAPSTTTLVLSDSGKMGDTVESSLTRRAREKVALQRLWRRITLWGGASLVALGCIFLVLLFSNGKKTVAPLPTTELVVAPSTEATGDAAFRRWLENTASLGPEAQVKAVSAKLKERNPGFDGVLIPTTDRGVIVGLEMRADNIVDLSPVRALPKLETLTCTGTAPGKGKLADLAPLRGLGLHTLRITHTAVVDLSPLRDLHLKVLHCNGTAVTDLGPLKGMALWELNCSATGVTDLAPLQGMPLTTLHISWTKVTDLASIHELKLTTFGCETTPVKDLTPLQKMPLQSLNIAGTPVADLGPLRQMTALASLNCRNAKITDFRPLLGLSIKHLNCAGTKVVDLGPLQRMPLVDLVCRDTLITDLAPLHATSLGTLDCANLKITDLSALDGLPLQVLNCSGTGVADLHALKNLPLEDLDCGQTRVSDLRPLANLSRLRSFKCAGCPIDSVGPLQGLPLSTLDCRNTKVADLSALRTLKQLALLNCAGCPVTDWSPLKGLPLKDVTLDVRPGQDLAPLKELPSLVKINGKVPADFFRDLPK